MNERLVSISNRNLERQSKLFGFEIMDVFVIFLFMSGLNFIFGETAFRFPLVFGGTITLALILFITKRGKAENYLLYKARYLVKPAILYAGSHDSNFRPYLMRKN